MSRIVLIRYLRGLPHHIEFFLLFVFVCLKRPYVAVDLQIGESTRLTLSDV